MLKVTNCIGVKSFVEALINMVCELKITSGCKKKKKKKCKNFMVIRHSIKELLAKSMVTWPMKCIVVKKNSIGKVHGLVTPNSSLHRKS